MSHAIHFIRHTPCHIRNSIAAAWGAALFLRTFIQRPSTVGSVCPSSAALTDRLLAGISRRDDGLVIDLGAGSGPVSAAMLRSGIARDRIIAVEALGGFAAPFSARCPGVRLVVGDARNLNAILDREAPGRPVSAIVSSLPFRVLGPDLTRDILREIHLVLRERGGTLVQYSYAWWMRYPLRASGFTPMRASIEWKNLPPARVEAYAAGG
jgi:Phospholipid N-methyltransferase